MDPRQAAELARSDPDGTGETFDDTGGESTSNLRGMMMSTNPPVSPANVDGALNLGVPWHKHMEAFIAKASGSEGTPAVVHLVVAMALLATDGADISDMVPTGGDSDDSSDERPAAFSDNS